jgi:hypothetical protein
MTENFLRNDLTMPPWWQSLPKEATPRSFSLRQRLFGPIIDRGGSRLGFFSRLSYEWLISDDPYYVRLDNEISEGEF